MEKGSINLRMKIVSGGQTGADRAALEWAISRGIPHGGWCPKGRLAEDGIIPAQYNLHEMKSADYLRRTEQNVIDSDGTVIFTLTGGSKRTMGFAAKHLRPVLHLCAASPYPTDEPRPALAPTISMRSSDAVRCAHTGNRENDGSSPRFIACV